MNSLATLGLVAGGFLLMPKGWVITSCVLWLVAKLNPTLAVLIFTASLIFGGGR